MLATLSNLTEVFAPRFRIFMNRVSQGQFEWSLQKGWERLKFEYENVVGEDGKPVTTIVTGKDGKTVLGEDGKPFLRNVVEPVVIKRTGCPAPSSTNPSIREGVFFLINPVDGEIHPNAKENGKNSSRSLESCASFSFALLESDDAPKDLWLRLVRLLPFRVVSIATSGSSSYHVLLHIGAKSMAEWSASVEPAKRALTALGADPNTIRLIQLSRLPFFFRANSLHEEQQGRQELIYLAPKPSLFPTAFKSVDDFVTAVGKMAIHLELDVFKATKRDTPKAKEVPPWEANRRSGLLCVKTYELERRATRVVMSEFQRQIKSGEEIDISKAVALAYWPGGDPVHRTQRVYNYYKDHLGKPPPIDWDLFLAIWHELRKDQGKKFGPESSSRPWQNGTQAFKNLAHSYTALRDRCLNGDDAFDMLTSKGDVGRDFKPLWELVRKIVKNALFTRFTLNNFIDLKSFATKLKHKSDKVSSCIARKLSKDTHKALGSYKDGEAIPEQLQQLLLRDINKIVKRKSIYGKRRFYGILLRPETEDLRKLLDLKPNKDDVPWLNSLLIEDAYHQEITKKAIENKQVEEIANVFVRCDLLHCEKLFAIYEPAIVAKVKTAIFLLRNSGKDRIYMADLEEIVPHAPEEILKVLNSLKNKRYGIENRGIAGGSVWIVPIEFCVRWREENPTASVDSPANQPPSKDNSVSEASDEVLDEANEAINMDDRVCGLLSKLESSQLGCLTAGLPRDVVIDRLEKTDRYFEKLYGDK